LKKDSESITSGTAVNLKNEFEKLAANYGFECVLEEVVPLPSQDLKGTPCILECIVRRFRRKRNSEEGR